MRIHDACDYYSTLLDYTEAITLYFSYHCQSLVTKFKQGQLIEDHD